MPKYTIKIKYETGDSFGSRDEEDFVELEWEDLDKAKESLKRIKSHYEFYTEYGDFFKKPEVKLPLGTTWNDKYHMLLLSLVTDKGKEYSFSPFWCGYFEKLYEAKIVISKDPEEEFVYTP